MSPTTTEYEPGNQESVPLRPVERPRPLGSSLVAAAARMTGTQLDRVGASVHQGWQEDAWDMYDLVGEQRFLARTLAARMAQARFFVARLPDNTTEDIEPIEDDSLPVQVFGALGGARASFSQIVERCGINLFVTGDGWLVGTPASARPTNASGPDSQAVAAPPSEGIAPTVEGMALGEVDLGDVEWAFRSVSEVEFQTGGEVKVYDGSKQPPTYKADDLIMIRVWRPHPRRWWESDSPTRSSLPILRELVGLTMHISAQVDSRLAGAGVFLVPASADAAIRAQVDPEVGSDPAALSPLVDAIMEAMVTPISDRSSASALVPIMPVVPDESIDKFRFISFAVPLDTEARPLRDEAIRRLALGEDCPPELLLGMATLNHWGAWLVREDVVTSHLEPPLALICDATTTQYLWPVLEQAGVDNPQQYVIWYDVSHLIVKPDRTKDAKDLHSSGALSDTALRAAAGFDETDAPMAMDPAVAIVLDLVRAAPSLAQAPGMPVLLASVQAMLAGEAPPDPVEEAEPVLPEDTETQPADDETADDSRGLPDTAEDEAPLAASGAVGWVPSGEGFYPPTVMGHSLIPENTARREPVSPIMVPYRHGQSPEEVAPSE